MADRSLLVATRNTGKLSEIARLIEEAGFRPVTLDDAGIAISAEEDALEVFDTFEANALAKGRWFQRIVSTAGLDVLADDSGLAVEALGGAPGVRSKRWSGSLRTGRELDDDNNRTLQAALEGARNRRAKYVCVAAIVARRSALPGEAVGGAATAGGGHEVVELIGRGESAGVIVDAPKGRNGFGYDPYFWSDDLAMTFGEASGAAKARVSHRARAVGAVIEEYAVTLGR